MPEPAPSDPTDYGVLFQAHPEPMWVYDLKTLRFLDVNRAAEAQYGYTREEFLSMTIGDIRPPEDVPLLLENVDRTFTLFEDDASRLDDSGVWRHHRKGGEVILVQILSHPVVFEGNPAELVLARNVTEERKLQHRLESQTALSRIAGRMARVGAWWVDLQTEEVHWTDEVYAIHEVPLGTRIRMEGAIGFFAPEWQPTLTRHFKECVERGRPYDLELEIITAAGNRIWVRTIAEAVRNDQGVIVRVQGAFQDIRQLKESEAQVRHWARRLSATLESITDAVLALDDEWRITYVNPEAERILERPATELVGRTVWEEFPEAVGSDFQHHYQMALDTRRVQAFDAFFPPLNLWFRVRAYPADVGLTVYFQDITELRRRTSEALRAQRLETIGSLAGGIAHDLNNVLSPMLLAAGLLHRQDLNDEANELLTTIEESAARGAEMVQQVLAFARGVDGAREPVSPSAVIEGVIRLVREILPRNIQMEYHASPELPQVLGDATQLHQVVMNLCLNARDAMPEGGLLAVTVDAAELDPSLEAIPKTEEAKRCVRISVADTGAGMTPDIIERLWDPFFTTKEMGKGTGLGLPTALAIVRSHGGHMTVQSEPGRGSTFAVYIPEHQSSALHATVEAVDPPAASSELPRGNGEVVLMIEDELAIRSVARRTLETFGYRVVLAKDGAEGVEIYRARQDEVDVVLTDIMMPVMDGREAARQIRSLNPDARIITSSGTEKPGDRAWSDSRAGEALNPQHFLGKPYTTRELLEALQEALRDPKARD